MKLGSEPTAVYRGLQVAEWGSESHMGLQPLHPAHISQAKVERPHPITKTWMEDCY